MKYLVIGLGTYGRELALTLSAQGNEVIGVDNKPEAVESVQEKLATVYQMDSSDENALRLLPIKTMDAVIVAIGEDFASSLKTVAILRKFGTKRIFARAIDPLHKSILEAFKVDRILTPEKRAAKDLTFELAFGARTSTFNISDDYIILKFSVPEQFVGHSYRSINLARFGLVMIAAVRKTTETNSLGLPMHKEEILDMERRTMEEKILKEDEIAVLGSRKNISDFIEAQKSS